MVMVAHQLSMASIHGSSGRVLSTLLLTACTPMPMWRGRPCARATVPQLMGRGADTSGGLSMEDPRLYTVEVDRVTGIDFGCDLTLRWPYVLAMVPEGSAARSGVIDIGDQLVAIAGASVLGLPIGEVMERLAAAEGGTEVSLIFFRGEREELQNIVGASNAGPATATVTVTEPGKPDQVFEVPYGANLRDELIARKINCKPPHAPPCASAKADQPPALARTGYQSVTRWTNCNGQQLCGTCIVDVTQGIGQCTRRSLDEASTLRENPDTYKLACVTNVYGDITIQLCPKIGAAQWTR